MRRISGHLREVVACESQTAGGLLQGKVRGHQPFVESLVHAIFGYNTKKNALSSVESRVFVDTISSEEANRARAFVSRRGLRI